MCHYIYYVQPEDLDANGKATVPALYRIAINSIGKRIREEGYGIDVMSANGLSWVIVRCGVEFLRRPDLYESLRVDVWRGESSSVCQERCFSIKGEMGEEICRGVTHWCVMDSASRRPVQFDITGPAAPSSLEESAPGPARQAPCLRPRRIASFSAEGGERRCASYCECDFNGHLNNVKYLEMFLDLLPRSVAGSLSPLRLDLNFRKEVPCGDIIRTAARPISDGCYEFCMYHGNTPACSARLCAAA